MASPRLGLDFERQAFWSFHVALEIHEWCGLAGLKIKIPSEQIGDKSANFAPAITFHEMMKASFS